MSKLIRAVLCSSLVLGSCTFSYAANLTQAAHDALLNNLVYRSAKESMLATDSAAKEALSLWLPQVELKGLATSARYKVKTENEFLPDTHDTYSPSQFGWGVVLKQNLLNFTAIEDLKAAGNEKLVAALTYAAKQQVLLEQVVKAYFAVLLAQNNVETAQSFNRLANKTFTEAKHNYQIGLQTKDQLYDAKAQALKAQGQLLVAKNSLSTGQRLLVNITQRHYPAINKLSKRIRVHLPRAHTLNYWQRKSIAHNVQLKVLAYRLELLRTKLKAIEAKRLPKLQAYVGYQDSYNKDSAGASMMLAPIPYNASISTANRFHYSGLGGGIELTMPLFSGGDISFDSDSAAHKLASAEIALDNERQQLRMEVTNSFEKLLTLKVQIKAQQQQVIADQTALKYTQDEVNQGKKTTLDLLQVQTNTFEAVDQLTQERYDYIVDLVHLEYLAADLNKATIKRFNSWLSPQLLRF